ncbi:MAG: hypothetical protein ACPGXJ_07395 [Pseudomonadales bacterium]
MQDQIEFIDGLFAKAPHPNAPDFVKAKISIKREELLSWLSGRGDEWINIDVKEARSGKWYAAVDNWQPNAGANPNTAAMAEPAQTAGTPQPPMPEEDFDDDIPF